MIRIAGAALLFITAFATPATWAAPSDEDSPSGRGGGAVPVRKWNRWVTGFDTGTVALGKFGRNSSLNAPPGDLYVKVGGHLWYKHFVQLQVQLGIGMGDTRYVYGVGTKINLIEMSFIPSLLPGAQRGVLAPFLGNFMIFLTFNYNHYNFHPPDPAVTDGVWSTASWSPEGGIGAQWYAQIPSNFARRFYLETTLQYTVIQQNRYLAPYLTIGFELK